jgi:hypothetical protein
LRGPLTEAALLKGHSHLLLLAPNKAAAVANPVQRERQSKPIRNCARFDHVYGSARLGKLTDQA